LSFHLFIKAQLIWCLHKDPISHTINIKILQQIHIYLLSPFLKVKTLIFYSLKVLVRLFNNSSFNNLLTHFNNQYLTLSHYLKYNNSNSSSNSNKNLNLQRTIKHRKSIKKSIKKRKSQLFISLYLASSKKWIIVIILLTR
jgi:hypothetical protein